MYVLILIQKYMLLRDDRLQMYYNGQLSGNYRPHVPRAEFAKKALFVSGGKIAREDIDFVNSFCKESHD